MSRAAGSVTPTRRESRREVRCSARAASAAGCESRSPAPPRDPCSDRRSTGWCCRRSPRAAARRAPIHRSRACLSRSRRSGRARCPRSPRQRDRPAPARYILVIAGMPVAGIDDGQQLAPQSRATSASRVGRVDDAVLLAAFQVHVEAVQSERVGARARPVDVGEEARSPPPRFGLSTAR